jgi:predicted  nucleic acid-binding Zn-ribbon protein
MAVATAAILIRTLHRIQRQLTDLRGRLEAGPRQIATQTGRLTAAESARTQLTESLRLARKKVDDKQLQLRSAEAKITDLEAKRNTAKTNREYQLLGEQIDADRAAIRVLEDEILEALEGVDAITAEQPAADQQVNDASATLDSLKQRVSEEAAHLEKDIAHVTTQLEQAEADLTDDVRELYQRVVKHKGEDGMATSESGCCGGCHQQLTGKLLSQLLAGNVAMCRSCGRLLYEPDRPS